MKKIITAILFLGMMACKPGDVEKIDIGNLPDEPSFSFEKIDENNLRFTTNVKEVIPYWDFGNGQTGSGASAEAFFPRMGDYDVTLTVYGKGGSASSSQTVTIDQNDPNLCSGFTEFLTGCGNKTWNLLQDAGAMWVGPDSTQNVTWWQNTVADITTRACQWDDDFNFDLDGSFEYDAKGQVWVEAFMGYAMDMCLDESQLTATYQPWGSGTHQYNVDETGVNPKLTVSGLGAFVGLPKAANGMETTVPINSVTYDVLEYGDVGGQDRMKLLVNFGGGFWIFTLVSD